MNEGIQFSWFEFSNWTKKVSIIHYKDMKN